MDVTISTLELVDRAVFEKLFQLHSQLFDNLKYNDFIKDMESKDRLILISENGRIAGFSTIQIIPSLFENVKILFVFSGNTVVHPDYWQMNLLLPAFGAFLKRLMDSIQDEKIYWFLLSKGFRTYLMMPTFFKSFYPGINQTDACDYKKLIDYIAARMYPGYYNPLTGLISFKGTKDYLNQKYGMIPEVRKNNKYIDFFLKKNPDYHCGDELACITRIARENFKPLAYNLLNSNKVRWVE